MSKFVLVWFILVVLVPTNSLARVWTVEVDGSGDFTDLQSASDAAASGDTIRIGEGRFGEPTWSECLGDRLFFIMGISVEDIVILGEGAERSIIGPEEPWHWQLPFRAGIAAVGFCGTARMTIKNVGFEHLTHAIHCEFASNKKDDETTRLVVDECGFRDNYTSLHLDANVNIVENCTNYSNVVATTFATSYLGAPLRESYFRNCQSEFTSLHGRHIALAGVLLSVQGCEFSAHNIWSNASGIVSSANLIEVKETSIRNGRWGITRNAGDLYVSNVEFSNLQYGVWLKIPDHYIEMVDCSFNDILKSSISYSPTTRPGFIRNCDLCKGESFVISRDPNYRSSENLSRPDESRMFIDMSNNYWGTDNPDSIRAWIEDGEDLEDWPYFINWMPYSDHPVEVKKQSLDGLKALFR